ncbi:MAG: anaerobic glycerol-3-phosphate dehydrogenase subunit B [Desulfovibrio sp.]|jgi:glycerol-3-phosphate dehydrogenase|nr:anaerobic glycerol-3-phosphate dehydrogenase subunit B [Desulfovibrio sp.]
MNKTLKTRVVVIGGGATGTGTARDLSMRGIPCILLEQGDLCAGASSRFHGLLHSGARYALGDPEAARECISENRILRHIASCCIEKTEGWFTLCARDDPVYTPLWLAACANCGIDAQEIAPARAFKLEPNLSRDIKVVYRVPDSAVDGFRMVRHNAASARLRGAQIYPYTRVTGIITEQGKVVGVTAQTRANGETIQIECEYLINASGAWAGQVAALAGVTLGVSPDRGLLLAFNHRFTDRVINRLRKSQDGDIFVPHGNIVIFGTTSVPVDSPDETGVETKEALRLLEEGEAVFPSLRSYRILRAFAGTRPLYSPDAASGRSATRNFVILDHEPDGLKGMATVTGGKFTSFRLMAEKICDLAAKRLGVPIPCRTAQEPLVPEPSKRLLRRAAKVFPLAGADPALARLGLDLEKAVAVAESSPWKKILLCECEMVTQAEFETAAAEIAEQHAKARREASPGKDGSPPSRRKTDAPPADKAHAFHALTILNDLRRRTRMGMGTCQGNFCALRAGAALAESGVLHPLEPQKMLREFLEERWRGIRPLLWGRQLREVELERGIYLASLNIDGRPGQYPSPFPGKDATAGKTACLSPSPAAGGQNSPPFSKKAAASPGVDSYEVIVVGAGLSGLVAAISAAERGRKTLLLSKGAGALSIGGGTIDILGYLEGAPIRKDPIFAFKSLKPDHPYALLGSDAVLEALEFIKRLSAEEGDCLIQAGDRENGNAWLPTSAGTLKPVWLAGPGMDPAALRCARSLAVAGIEGLKDFSPRLLARGLSQTEAFAGKTLLPVMLPLPPALARSGERDLSSLDLARFVDSPEGTDWLRRALEKAAARAQAVLVPAILGVCGTADVHSALLTALSLPIMEAICPPPAVAGLRIQRMLRERLRRLSVSVFGNIEISGARVENGHCLWLETQNNGKGSAYPAESFIIATGGVFGNGINTLPGKAFESIFKLPLSMPERIEAWSETLFFASKPHSFARMGVTVNKDLHPVDETGAQLLDNVFFAGKTLGGYDFASEKSGSGVALCTGRFAGSRA